MPEGTAVTGENRNAKFRRLAEQRVQEVLQRIDRIGNLSSRNYDYSEEEAAQVVEALQRAVARLGERLGRPKPEKSSFSFE